MEKSTLTEDKAEQTPTGGVLVGKREGQTIIHNKGSLSGYLVGKTHAEGGIKAVNKSTGQPLEMQGGEVVITAPAVSDQTKREFEGKMMTNREILSAINEKGGGVAFAKGGDIPKDIKRTGASYRYGGRTMTDHEIYKYIIGGHLAEGYSLREIANIHQVPLSELKEQVRIGMKAESEHTSSKREQMIIVKDHLFENPKYYTLLKKAGLEDGGKVKDNLVRDAKSGNTPARDLNNYNDVLDIDADGMVGAETGLYADGGGVGERLTKKVIQYNALNNGWYLETIGGYGNPMSVLYDKNGKEIKSSTKWEIKDKWSTYFEEIGIIGVLKDPNYPKSYHRIYKKDIRFAKGGLIAPNGKTSNLTPEQYKLVRTPEFKAWFGDWENDPENASKVVDENGEPLVVYHGTYVENPFYIFDFDKADLGFHFGTYEQAKNRSETKLFFKGRKSIVNSFFLNIKTIFESTDIGEWEYPQRYIDMFVSDGLISESDAKKNGFYRLVQREENKQIREYLLNKYGKFGGFVYNNKYEGKGNSFIVLNPNQIKLADGTNTTFDTMNPDIRYDTGGMMANDVQMVSTKYLNSIRSQGESNWDYDLEKSIEINGVKEPIIIGYWEELGKVSLLDGHHRLDASMSLGINKIPVIIVNRYDYPYGKVKLYDSPILKINPKRPSDLNIFKNDDIRYAIGGDVKPYDANMEGDSAHLIKEEELSQENIKEAIETLEILSSTATRKEKQNIKEATEVLKMLSQTN